uniref:Secreted protein n=1 Tax=Knipowitschia caucasica TaxID=637954 RepID=A0AAV2ML75_KNICA
MKRRVSPLSTTAHRLPLLSGAAVRAPSADPLTSTEDEHQQHVHKHQNRYHRKHHASLDIQGHGAALRAEEKRSHRRLCCAPRSSRFSSEPSSNPPLQRRKGKKRCPYASSRYVL